METINVTFTRRRWNPISWLIRWAVPRSRFSLALSSHCMVSVGDRVFEAHMIYGVRETDRSAALRGATVVKETCYQVTNADAGIAFAREQVLKRTRYDWAGALGLCLTPGRDWKQDDKFFCYEFAAAVLHASGRHVFNNLTHVGETALMAINP
ncbi:hypothetical protein ACFSQU_18165 [Massilia sp. GCM10020059]|uniref:Permuted papain-like amidase YaeF/Yiix C92 family enzyme n=1 Tax=Massilia agrisoli TaxID=2892444 RepID=A0ABS8ITG5_9BURK|nr:hypothetical protein [Massilia agrisoli]MCC6071468.1 hypothetical protein [Massilia agrisoli]